MKGEILVIQNKKEEKFLRKKTVAFDFGKFSRKEINDLIIRMRKIMHQANGIGLSANQIGLEFRMFVAEIPASQSDGGTDKFYAIFNPKIEKSGGETETTEEGCLSIPGKWGNVKRFLRITVSGYDKNGKPLKIKAWGLLARVFQHEIDHLDGKLFIDRTKDVHDEGEYEEK